MFPVLTYQSCCVNLRNISLVLLAFSRIFCHLAILHLFYFHRSVSYNHLPVAPADQYPVILARSSLIVMYVTETFAKRKISLGSRSRFPLRWCVSIIHPKHEIVDNYMIFCSCRGFVIAHGEPCLWKYFFLLSMSVSAPETYIWP